MNYTLFVGVVIGLLSVMIAPLVITTEVNAYRDPCAEALDHIKKAEAALQNGDREGANNHLELAKQRFAECAKYVPPN